MTFGRLVGVFADVHGNTRTLERALARCEQEGVQTIALLGDLFDRAEQADATVAPLVEWDVVGVYGNHEREVALAASAGELEVRAETLRLLAALQEEVVIEDVRLAHEVEHWGRGHHDLLHRLLDHLHHHEQHDARVTFTGHTHFRQARAEHGTLDIGRGSVTLDPSRRYLLNPGPLMLGQYIIWDRESGVVRFEQVEW